MLAITLNILTFIFWGIAIVIQFMVHNRTNPDVPPLVRNLLVLFVALGCVTFSVKLSLGE